RVARRVLAADVRAVARVGGARIAVLRARGPVRLLRVGRTVGRVARAALGDVALPRRYTTGGARGLEEVGRAATATARAGLGDVARAGRRTADGPRIARVVDARRGADRAVARVGGADVAVVRARRPGRLDQVGRAARARAGAGLAEVALVRRRTADRARVARRVLAADVRAVARVGGARIAVLRARGPVRLLRVGRTVGRVARAALGDVALPRRCPTGGARGLEEVGRAAATTARAPPGAV